MKKVTPIFVLLLVAAMFAAVGFFPRQEQPQRDESEQTTNITTYSKMAMLAMQPADEKLALPVKGVRKKQIADTWGAPRGADRSHQGQDIFAKKGTPVYSATEGYVLRVGESPLGGKTVFVFGAGGRRYYYAHLDAHAPDLKAGDYVTTESLIGYVGATGNAKGTPPHLHFGVYAAGGAINPLPLIEDRIQHDSLRDKEKKQL